MIIAHSACTFAETVTSGTLLDETVVQKHLPEEIGPDDTADVQICPSQTTGCNLTLRALAASVLGARPEALNNERPESQVPEGCYYLLLNHQQFVDGRSR